MKKSSVFKILSVSLFLIMVFTLINSLVMDPLTLHSKVRAVDKDGESFTNASGFSVCWCDELKDQCEPCFEEVPNQ